MTYFHDLFVIAAYHQGAIGLFPADTGKHIIFRQKRKQTLPIKANLQITVIPKTN